MSNLKPSHRRQKSFEKFSNRKQRSSLIGAQNLTQITQPSREDLHNLGKSPTFRHNEYDNRNEHRELYRPSAQKSMTQRPSQQRLQSRSVANNTLEYSGLKQSGIPLGNGGQGGSSLDNYLSQDPSMRKVPKNRRGVQDEWSALIQLQNEVAERESQAKKAKEALKKRAYLNELQQNIDHKRQEKVQVQLQKQKEAADRLVEEQKLRQLELMEQEVQQRKRNELSEMNRKQVAEFRVLKKKAKEEEMKFALEANKEAEEQEKREKLDMFEKQKHYAKDLLFDIEKKKQLKQDMRENDKKMKHIEMEKMERTRQEEQAKQFAYKQKFKEFEKKLEKKNDWYQKHIIQPQIEKYLQDFDKERVYNEQYNQKQIKHEQEEAIKKKTKEKQVLAGVVQQISEKKRRREEFKRGLEAEKKEVQHQVAESKIVEQQEFESAKKKKYSYKDQLDEQVKSNTKMKPVSMMTEIERNLNRHDLNSYLNRENSLSTMIPGIHRQNASRRAQLPEPGSPERKLGVASVVEPRGHSLLSTDFVEKQKRLQQYGFSKDALTLFHQNSQTKQEGMKSRSPHQGPHYERSSSQHDLGVYRFSPDLKEQGAYPTNLNHPPKSKQQENYNFKASSGRRSNGLPVITERQNSGARNTYKLPEIQAQNNRITSGFGAEGEYKPKEYTNSYAQQPLPSRRQQFQSRRQTLKSNRATQPLHTDHFQTIDEKPSRVDFGVPPHHSRSPYKATKADLPLEMASRRRAEQRGVLAPGTFMEQKEPPQRALRNAANNIFGS